MFELQGTSLRPKTVIWQDFHLQAQNLRSASTNNNNTTISKSPQAQASNQSINQSTYFCQRIQKDSAIYSLNKKVFYVVSQRTKENKQSTNMF